MIVRLLFYIDCVDLLDYLESVEDYCVRNARKLERSGRRTDMLADARKWRNRQQRRSEQEEMERGMFYPAASVFHTTANRKRGLPTPRPLTEIVKH